MNDPNGLIYFDGEYHQFYPYNPFGVRLGHMIWGHAKSRHLAYWHERPPTLNGEDSTLIFWGSCVIDKTNSSGFGRGSTPPSTSPHSGPLPPADTTTGPRCPQTVYPDWIPRQLIGSILK
ncbi:glycoside hydrolase family protein [Spirosoma endophyticum]|uniref:hypothetical protein n=1 Tax=Spirosoma endophyticum TaxID=662367 RepID=UPI000B8A4498